MPIDERVRWQIRARTNVHTIGENGTSQALDALRPVLRPGWDVLREPPDEEVTPQLLLVESLDMNRRLLRGVLRDEGYRIFEAADIHEAFAVLRTERIDLVVIDLVLPEVSGLDFCRAVKSNHETRLIPVLVMTSVPGVENEIASIAAGADEFLVKPIHPGIMRTRVDSMLRQKRTIDSLEEAESILFALAPAVELRDRGTFGHCDRLATLSMALGTALGLGRSQILELRRGGYLHDIGKIGIPDAILFKPGSLTADEWVIMQSHTLKGVEICRPARTLRPVLPIIRSHHERWDGTGYPDRLKREEIPLTARILQVADVFDALTSVRPYKEAYPPSDALAVLRDEMRRGWRDPTVVAALEDICLRSPEDVVMLDRPAAPSDAVGQSLLNMRSVLADADDSPSRSGTAASESETIK